MAKGKIPFEMRKSYFVTMIVGIAADALVLSGCCYAWVYEEWFLVAFFLPLLLALLSAAIFKFFFYSIFKIDPGEFRFKGLEQPSVDAYIAHESTIVRGKAKLCVIFRRVGVNAYIWLLVTIPATLKLSLIH